LGVKKREIYVVTDVEADGPVPAIYSMRSLGSVAVTESGDRIGYHTFNLLPLPEARTDPDTMAFWAQHPQAWQACNEMCQDPAVALPNYRDWLKSLPGEPVFVAYPAAYDFMFTAWYLHTFAGECPFGYSALCVKTLAMVYGGDGYLNSGSRVSKLLGRPSNPHVAFPDAELEAEYFLELLRRVRAGERLREAVSIGGLP
jgi:hypothetical protein